MTTNKKCHVREMPSFNRVVIVKINARTSTRRLLEKQAKRKTMTVDIPTMNVNQKISKYQRWPLQHVQEENMLSGICGEYCY